MMHRCSSGSAAVLSAFFALTGLALPSVGARHLDAQGQAAANEFFDSHFHLTNYVQKGTDVRRFLEIMGTRVGRSTLFGIPLQQHWSYANSGDFAPTYYLQTDAPLYYYSFTDAYIASVYRSLSPAEQARFDPMITGLQPGRHVRRRPHSASPRDLPRCLHRHRRVQHPQGVRLRQGVRRDGEPDEPGARSHPRLRCGDRPRRHPAQRHRRAIREGQRRACLSLADEGAAQATPQRLDHLGSRRPRTHRPPGPRVSAEAAERSPTQLDIVESIVGDPEFESRRTSTSRGTKSPSTRSRRRNRSRGSFACSTPTPIASSSAPTRWRRRRRSRTSRCSTCGRPSGRS